MDTKPSSNRAARDVGDIYLDSTYLENNPGWHIEDSAWKARQIQKMLSRHSIEPKQVCEIGCGAGEILQQLSAWNPATQFVGYEVSPQAFAMCQSRESDRVKYVLGDLVERDVRYDVLLCIDVFEHVEDYFGFLKALRSKAVLKIFHVPLDLSAFSVMRDAMMSSRRTVGHLHYFSRQTALATLRDCGYEVVDEFFTPHFADLPSKSLAGRLARVPRQLLFHLAPEFKVRLLGGCSLLVLAR